MLVWLERRSVRSDQYSDDVPREPSVDFIDSLVSAELPDVLVDPVAYVLVDEFMVHGPCGQMNPGCP